MTSLPKAAVPAALDVHLILDNYATHKTPLVCAGRDFGGEGVATSGKQRPTESLPSAQYF